MLENQNTNLVIISNNKPKTTSLKIAEYFGKLHKDVLEKIKNLETSQEFTERNFTLSSYTDISGKSNPMYEITENGFTFLTMGFTGKKASKFKEDYILAFEKMKEFLQNQIAVAPSEPNFNLPKNYEEALEVLLSKVKSENLLTLENAELKPKASYFEITVNQNPENISIQEITTIFLNQEKGITISTFKVWQILKENNWIFYRKRNLNSKTKIPFPDQKIKEKGWLTTTEKKESIIINEETGETKNFLNTQILITPSGRLELLKLVLEFIKKPSKNNSDENNQLFLT